MPTTSLELDKFGMHLKEMTKKLQECQINKNLKTCSDCDQYLSCELRTDYVKSVYNSMSKGDTGGFEF
jgi:hypothetical protein